MNRQTVGPQFGLAAIAVAAAALIGLTWFGTVSAVRIQYAEAEARIAGRVANQAQVFEERLRRQLLEVDQILRILADAWKAEPARFSLPSWHSQLVLLEEISPDVFIADETGVVRHHTIAAAVGSRVNDSDYFRHAAARTDDDDRIYISAPALGPIVQQWHVNVVRRLRHQDGSFAGVIVAAVRASALSSYYKVANLGAGGMLLIVDTERGQTSVGMAEKPIDPGSDISQTAMFRAMQRDPNGVWVGPSASDGIVRVHGFHRVPNQNLEAVVAIEHAEVMEATARWVIAAYIFAAGITVLLLLMAGILWHTVSTARRRAAALAGERAMLAAANAQLELTVARADAKSAQLDVTLSGMSDGLAMIDAQLQLLEWNPRFAELAGVPNDILRVGLPMEDILRAQAAGGEFGEVDIEAEVARRMALLHVGSAVGTIDRTRPDGTVLELRRNRLPDGGYVTLYTDITVRKQTENMLRQASIMAEAAAQAMSRFVAIVSHEIRTPLNALLSSLTLLADSPMEPAQRKLLTTASQSGSALAALINDILEMSRMEAGQLTLRPSVFALRPLVESALDMFRAPAAERNIVLRQSMANGVPDEMFTDPGRLRQVLINLLSNAVKFAAPGEVRVTADTTLTGGKTKLRLAVRDRGPVIPAEQRGQLFQPFSRLEQADSEGRLGTGLGLAICRHLVALMSGEIGCDVWFVGGHEAGNEFWIVLPLPLATSPAGTTPETIGTGLRRVLPRTRILLVEDILANQLVTATLLRREGHLVDIAGSGEACLRALQHAPYDLVFMDIFMPGMNGAEAARRMRALPGPAATTPIVALTANVCAEDRALCTAAGMNGLLSKPVALTDLLGALAQHVWPFRSRDILLEQPVASGAEATWLSPALSAARLAELRASVPAATLSRLVDECLAELAERLPKLRQEIQQQAAEAAFAQAHAMAGMAASYGMLALENRLRLLMHCIRDAPSAVAAVASELDADFERTAGLLQDALDEAPVRT